VPDRDFENVWNGAKRTKVFEIQIMSRVNAESRGLGVFSGCSENEKCLLVISPSEGRRVRFGVELNAIGA
jgi:hypothetical protein